MAKKKPGNPLYDILRAPVRRYDPAEIAGLFSSVGKNRVNALAGMLAEYIRVNLPEAIEKRSGLADYRTNPYVLLASANVMQLAEYGEFANFLFNNKLYMGLETSFGKSIEAAVLGQYPVRSESAGRWMDPPEKLTEADALVGLSREEKARRRRKSVWREIDKSCVVGERRYLVSIKSGPNCINDTQVQAMTDAITTNHDTWLEATKRTYPGVNKLDIIIGLTYGTERTTNNKENQILIKLLEGGFVEEGQRTRPGVLVSKSGKATRVYRQVGAEFWATVGDPADPDRQAGQRPECSSEFRLPFDSIARGLGAEPDQLGQIVDRIVVTQPRQ